MNSTRSSVPWSWLLFRRGIALMVLAAVAVGVATALADDDASARTDRLALGFFPNVTHAPAIVGVERDLFAAALGDSVELSTFNFNSGTEATEALFAGAIDIAFVGANPAINAYAKSDGEAIRIISGSTSGGAFLVVRPEIVSVEQLRGTTLASPGLGNTQDVALRTWLDLHGLETTSDGGGAVTILPQSNPTTLDAFVSGAIDGAWVPEPWATRLVRDGGGVVLVDERDLWPETAGRYPTALVVVRTEFLADHPDLVRSFLVGLIDSIELIHRDPTAAHANVVAHFETMTARPADADLIAASFDHLTFTLDPLAGALRRSAADAQAVGLLDSVDLAGIHDLTLLNSLLVERGDEPVEGL